eukprot:10944574-Alexandrium_andersonii.AAC.1
MPGNCSRGLFSAATNFNMKVTDRQPPTTLNRKHVDMAGQRKRLMPAGGLSMRTFVLPRSPVSACIVFFD